MSKLDKLLRERCPNGVEHKRIGDFAMCFPGATPKTTHPEYWENGTIPWMSSGEVNQEEVTFTEKKITQKGYDATSTKMVPANTVVIALAGQGKTRGSVAITRISLCTNQSLCAIVTDETVLSEYLFHYMRSQYLKLRDLSAGNGTRGGLNMKMIESYLVPVPPVEIQSEIVGILNGFTNLLMELTAELTARKAQYSYYRDKLLTFESRIQLLPLKEIAKFSYGYTDKAQEHGDTRFLRITDIAEDGTMKPEGAKYILLNDESKKYLVKKGDLLLARTGATYGKTLYVPDNSPAVYASFLIKIELDNSKISNRYYWHFSKSNQYWRQAEKLVSKGGQQQFNTNAVERVVVPVPPLDVQNRIVNVLDNFEKICSDLNIGLPAEIEARQKQYEYYRDKLLTFKEVAAT